VSPTAGAVNASVHTEPVQVLWFPSGTTPRAETRLRTIDLGPAVSLATNHTGAKLETLATVERVRSATTDDERQDRLGVAVTALERDVLDLQAEHAAALEAYSAGRIDGEALLLRLGRIGDRARELEERRASVDALVADAAAESGALRDVTARLNALRFDLLALQGPVRDRVVSVVRGDASPTRFFVAASPDALVVSMIVDGEYVREAFRGDFRGQTPGEVGPQDARNATRTAYPGVWATQRNSTAIGQARTFVVRVPHSRGRLNAYVDGRTGRVFRETQWRPLDSMENNETVSGTRDNLRLTVNRTYAGGPLRIELVDAESDAPVDLTVTIGPPDGRSQVVGSTGPDGVLWSISPAAEYTVTAINTEDPTAVSITAQPSAPPAAVQPTNETATDGPTTPAAVD
jgi:hypothetical protein